VLMDRITYWTGGIPIDAAVCQAVAADDSNLTAGRVDECAERLFLSSKAQRQDSNLSFVQQRMLPGEEEQRIGRLDALRKGSKREVGGRQRHSRLRERVEAGGDWCSLSQAS